MLTFMDSPIQVFFNVVRVLRIDDEYSRKVILPTWEKILRDGDVSDVLRDHYLAAPQKIYRAKQRSTVSPQRAVPAKNRQDAQVFRNRENISMLTYSQFTLILVLLALVSVILAMIFT